LVGWAPPTISHNRFNPLQLGILRTGQNPEIWHPEWRRRSGSHIENLRPLSFQPESDVHGFFLLLLSACLYVLHPVLWIFTLFSAWVHHKIVLKEEQFLGKRFGAEWSNYAEKTT